MSTTTPKTLRNQIMYQIFVRNFSEGGTFAEVTPQLDRIKALGVDVIWFAPIHPIGEKSRKGSLGSPYAIRDYRAINPEYGTMEDFKKVVREIHDRDMKCIIDVVYNHTSPDSVLASEHPEWFYRKADGSFGNHVGDWSDIIDLDYNNRDLWDYQIETLKMWAEIVDGFRCDVAPLVPLEFWKKARAEVEKVRPSALWLSESVEPGFITYLRMQGLGVLSDSEIFQAFDVSYEYDVYGDFIDYIKGGKSLQNYADSVNRQEYIYPDNYVKLRFLENHDQPRARFLFPAARSLRNATAFLFFQKGMTLLYAGQEYGIQHLPTLFDKDPVDWDSLAKEDISELISNLAELKRRPIFSDSSYNVKACQQDVLCATHKKDDRFAIGIFSLKGAPATVEVYIPDGKYVNAIDQSTVEVCHSMITTNGEPIIIMSDN